MTHLQQQFGEEEVKFTIHAARNDNLLLQVGRRMSASQELIDEIRTEAVRFAIEQQGMPKTTVATDILHVTNRLATR
ncbi:MAG: hypothetical protein SFT92_02155 [Rickettsiales bacterium]|nr:hypothetical protein [Rickettsiales bacterium]